MTKWQLPRSKQKQIPKVSTKNILTSGLTTGKAGLTVSNAIRDQSQMVLANQNAGNQ